MEVIHIKERNIDTIIYMNHNYYYGYRYVGNTIESIDNLNIIKSFLLSKNNTKLPKYGKYDVYLDNQTGIKHYFYHGIENFNLLFLNNGMYGVSYLGNKNKLSNMKKFTLKNKIVICTCLGLILALGNIEAETIKLNNNPSQIDNYELVDIKKMIYLSPNLTEEEKNYLYNEYFLTDILTIINDSCYEKYKMAECFYNIDIIGYNDEAHANQAGYYCLDTPSNLYIKNYTELNEANKSTIAHEFVHLCQDIGSYNLITEASAEIITKEYFESNHRYVYSTQVKLLKKLMEIIGSEPIWYYIFTGDFIEIEKRVSPYLTTEEYQKFLNDLSFEFDNYKVNKPKFEELDEILNNLYYRIYNKDIKDDEIISLIELENQNKELVRYYFNQNKINEENSYYLDYDLGPYETLSYEEAIDRGVISAYTISYTDISNEEAFRIIGDDNYHLHRNIDFKTHDIILYHSKHEKNKYTISGIIDGVKYEEADVDDLVKAGIIDVDYRIINRKDLTGADYKNHNYNDSEICYIRDRYTILNEDSVDTIVPIKISLPTIKTRYNIENKYTKKKKIT